MKGGKGGKGGKKSCACLSFDLVSSQELRTLTFCGPYHDPLLRNRCLPNVDSTDMVTILCEYVSVCVGL